MLVRAATSCGVVVKVSERLPDTPVQQGGQDRAVYPGEPGVVGQIAEDRAVVLEECGPVPALPSRRGPQLRRENVVDLVLLAVLVDALGVAGPAGHDRRRPGDRTAGRELVPDDREQELGNEIGGVGAQPGYGVAHLRVGEPLDELAGVLMNVDAGHRPQGRDGFGRHGPSGTGRTAGPW